MCSAFPCFLKPPGLNVPDIIVPDDIIPNKSTSLSSTGYSVLKPFLTKQGREVIECWEMEIAFSGLFLKLFVV